MEHAETHPHRSPNRWLLLAGVMLIGLVALVARVRSAFNAPVKPEDAQNTLPNPADTAVIPQSSISETAIVAEISTEAIATSNLFNQIWFRWVVLAEVLLAITWIVFNVQSPYSGLLLIFSTGSLLAAGAYQLQAHFLKESPQTRLILNNITVDDRAFIVALIALTAVALMIASSVFFAPENPMESLPLAALLMLIGGLTLWAANSLSAPTPAIVQLALPIENLHQKLPRLNPVHLVITVIGGILLGLLLISQISGLQISHLVQFQWLWLGVLFIMLGLNRVNLWRGLLLTGGIGLLALLAEINASYLGIRELQQITSNQQFGLLIGACGLIALGLGRRGDQPYRLNLQRRDILLISLVTGLALALRFWRLDDTARFFVDELSFSSSMGLFRVDRNVPLLVPMSSIAAFPYIFVYWQSWGESLFGRNYIGLRAASAVIGALTIPAIYFLGRVIADKKVALVGALLLAALPPHLHFSRLAINNIADPLFGTLAFAFLAKGVRDNQRLDYAIGGIFLGLTHYFYEGGRLLYTPLALIWIVALAIIWRRRIDKWNVLAAVSATFLVALPIYYTLLGLDRPITARMVDNATGLAREYWQALFRLGTFDFHVREHILAPLLAYVHRVELTMFYRGRTGILLAAVFPAALLGLFHALRRWGTPGALLLLLWVFAASAGNSLLVDSAASTRFVIVHPALMLLTAIGICFTLPLIITQARLQRVAIAVVAIGLALFQVHYYFNIHIPLYNEQFRDEWSHPDPQDAILRSVDFPSNTHIYFIGMVPPEAGFIDGVLHYFRDDLHLFTATREEITAKYIGEMSSDVDHAFFVEVGDTSTVELLKQHFYLLPAQSSPYDLPLEDQYLLYYAPFVPGYSDNSPPASP